MQVVVAKVGVQGAKGDPAVSTQQAIDAATLAGQHKDAAALSAGAANQSKLDTAQLKADTQQLKTDTQQLKTDTQQLKTDTTALRDAAQEIHDQTNQLKADTAQLKADTNVIKGQTQTLHDNTVLEKNAAIDAKDLAQGAAASAVQQKTLAETAANLAGTYMANLLAQYGSATALSAALTLGLSYQSGAVNAAELAKVYAAQAQAVSQPDTGGATNFALYRSPNPIVKTFVYDAQRDTDGGAWRKRCSHLPWYQEALNGQWLGPRTSEQDARGNNMAQYPEDFDNAYWTKSNVAITPNVALAPDGTMTMDKMENTLGVAGTRAISKGNMWSASNALKRSAILAKYVDHQWFFMSAGNTTTGVYFDLQNGVKGNEVGGATGTITADPATGGWILDVQATSVNRTPALYFVTGNGVGVTTGVIATGVSVQIWGWKTAEGVFTWTPYEAMSLQVGRYYQNSTDGKHYVLGATFGATETFRGNKAEFPAQAAIVAEASQIVIYDLTDDKRPMWMVFKNTASQSFISSATTTQSVVDVVMQNGVMVVGTGSNGFMVDFAKDAATRLASASTRYQYRSISRRNTQGGSNTGLAGALGFDYIPINSGVIRSVAMCVMPDAPFDPITGVQVPTIMVGTQLNGTLIQNNGTTVGFSGTSDSMGVAISPYMLFITRNDGSIYTIPNPGKLTSTVTLANFALPLEAGRGVSPVSRTVQAGFQRNTAIRASAKCLTQLRVHDGDLNLSMYAHATPGFATGWMCGLVKRAYLINQEAGSTDTTEKVTNPSFATNTDWTLSGTVNYAVGEYTLAATNSYIAQALANAKLGRTYRVTATVTVNGTVTSSGFRLRQGSAANTNTYGEHFYSIGATGALVANIVAGQDAPWITLLSSENVNITITDVNAVEVEGPRNMIGTGSTTQFSAAYMSITGALAKTAVATAAQTVWFEGWSDLNYMREAYHADYDTGAPLTMTGLSASVWTLPPATNPAPTGVELVLNGTFDANTNNWTPVNSNLASVAGQMEITNSGAASGVARQQVTVVAGKMYRLQWIALGGSGTTATSARMRVGSTAGGQQYLSLTNGTGVTQTAYFFATGTEAYIEPHLGTATAGNSVFFDNITLQEVVPDVLFERSAPGGAFWRMELLGDGRFRFVVGDGTTTREVITPISYVGSVRPIKLRGVYTRGGDVGINVNANRVATTSGAPLLTLDNAAAVFTVGNTRTLGQAYDGGKLAFLKIGFTVPTNEQAQYMFEQERMLFQDNAKCTLPDVGDLLDCNYDDMLDRVLTASAANEAVYDGLVRTSTFAYGAGAGSDISGRSGIKLVARTGASAGVDLTMPAMLIREEFSRRAEMASREARRDENYEFDTVSFNGDLTNNSNVVTNVASVVGAPYVGMGVSGNGIPANTTIAGINGTTYYLSNNATLTGAATAIAQTDFSLQTGYELKLLFSGGNLKRRGPTKDYVTFYDGFRETARFAVSPGAGSWLNAKARRAA